MKDQGNIVAGTASAVSTPSTGNTWVDSIAWGTHWTSGGSTTVVSTYLAGQSGGESIADGSGGSVFAFQPFAAELNAMAAAMAAFEAVCNIQFQNAASQADADLVWASVGSTDAGSATTLGWANPPGVGVVDGEAQGLVVVNWEA